MKKVVLAYVPVVSRAHVEFFKKHNLPIYVLAKVFLQEFSIIARDMRAVEPDQAVAMARSLGFEASLLDQDALASLSGENCRFIMPIDEIMDEFAERYLAGRQVERVNIWLRWNKIMATAEKEPAPDSVISSGEFDREMMNLALSVAQKSPDWWRQIGAILVKDGKPVVTAYNHPEPDDFAQYVDGDPRSNFNWGGDHIHLCSTTHGEIGVIAGAAARGVCTMGVKLYVTTFPCPPCARAIVTAGVSEVFYKDGYSQMDAEAILKEKGVKITLVRMNDQ